MIIHELEKRDFVEQMMRIVSNMLYTRLFANQQLNRLLRNHQLHRDLKGNSTDKTLISMEYPTIHQLSTGNTSNKSH